MTRWLPYPYMSAALLAIWLLLNQTLSPGHLLLGAILAILAPLAAKPLEVPPLRVRQPLKIPDLVWEVLKDIIRSNVAVTRIIVRPGEPKQTSGFVHIPLDLRNPYGLAMLAIIVTATPGTAWVNYDSRRGILLLHTLDLVDEAHWVDLIKTRYERRLMEIFE